MPVISDDEIRASFEVVQLENLPSLDGVKLSTTKLESFGEFDWPRIAAAAVTVLRTGVDPLDEDAIDHEALKCGLDANETEWLHSLFSPTTAIAVLGGAPYFHEGRHRTHVMRAQGVKECVVYTGRAEGGGRMDSQQRGRAGDPNAVR